MYSLFLAFANAIIAPRIISSLLCSRAMELHLRDIHRYLKSHARRTIEDAGLRRAAVLILFYPKDERLHLLFTKRTSTVEHHKGQISFPGGSMDDGDGTPVNTALRETHEEIGLEPSLVEILGVYHDQWTPTGFCITPVVGYSASLPPLTLNQHEVEEIIEVPVSFFLDPSHEEVRRLERLGRPTEVYFYQYGRHEVWGATAAIVRSFLADVAQEASAGARGSSAEEKNPLNMT
jgi:8-oxo-dGTP pyrophosphatase MutT (NUDIX family)